MTTVVLMRHGHALPSEADPERGLSERGRREAGAVADRLAADGVRVELVFHSGKKRAFETAGVLSRTIASGVPPLRRTGLEPHDDVSDIAGDLASTDVDTAVVGHIPHLEYLLARLLRRRPVQTFGTGNAARLRREGSVWTLAGFYAPSR
ncbi:MAG: histidine phosphatase family protein [Candidatus Eisenbacteria bacterium]